MVWEWNGVEMFSAILGPEMASEAISRASNFLWGGGGGGGGGGGMPTDSPSWCMLMHTLFHCNWVN